MKLATVALNGAGDRLRWWKTTPSTRSLTG
jgi:hypothetical protein